MIAIHTKYIGPTDKRGARIKAYTSDGRSKTIPYLDEHNAVIAHFLAAQSFIGSYITDAPDTRNMRFGDSADGTGYVFCFGESKISDYVQFTAAPK